MHRANKTVVELEAIGLQRVHSRPGCRGVRSIGLTFDEDGEWSFGAYEPGSVDHELVRWAVLAVNHQMHDEFELTTDT
jgi:hypothetical protein